MSTFSDLSIDKYTKIALDLDARRVDTRRKLGVHKSGLAVIPITPAGAEGTALATTSYAEAIGAYMISAIAFVLLGLTGYLGKSYPIDIARDRVRIACRHIGP